MNRSTISLILCGAWNLVRLVLILFFINTSHFPWGELRANLMLVWFATPGIAVAVLALNILWTKKQIPATTQPLLLLLTLDALIGFAVTILGLAAILVQPAAIAVVDATATMAGPIWNVAMPAAISFINGLFLWILYNQFSRTTSED